VSHYLPGSSLSLVCCVGEPTGTDASTGLTPGNAGPVDEIRVVAAVIRREDRLLICQRPAHKRHGGLWEFPGGKCEEGETDTEALRRELLEELGVNVVRSEAALLERHDEGSPFVIAFIPVEVEGEPAALEHSSLAWGTLAEIKRLPLAPSDRHFVDFLSAHDRQA
jgi:8-oxo-dGTP diphosphatase